MSINYEPIELRLALQHDCGTVHIPTALTYHARMAPSGCGEFAFTWEDKPHRVVYDLCTRIEFLEHELRRLAGISE